MSFLQHKHQYLSPCKRNGHRDHLTNKKYKNVKLFYLKKKKKKKKTQAGKDQVNA